MNEVQRQSQVLLLPLQGRIIVSREELAPRGGGEPIRDKFGELMITMPYVHPDASDNERVSLMHMAGPSPCQLHAPVTMGLLQFGPSAYVGSTIPGVSCSWCTLMM